MQTPTSSPLKRILFAIVFTIITTIIGFVINQLCMTLSDVIPTFIPINSTKRNMNSYERQIYENIINPKDIFENLDTIGGLEGIKQDIKSTILLPLKYPHIFFTSNVLKPSRGIILYGPPGTGKTMLAKAIASEANVPFISLSLSVLENKYFGESNKLIQGTFSLARKIMPCILFFDEIDGLMRQRNDLDQSAVYGFKTELLSQMDGMSSRSNDSIIVIGTTNNINVLDPALKRRLPKFYEVKLPDKAERLKILKLKTKEEVDISQHMLSVVAEKSEGLSGSDLTELIRQASSFRLQQICHHDDFQEKLKCARTVEDIDLDSLELSHFNYALIAMGQIKTEDANIQDLEDIEEDEALPPEEIVVT